MAEEKNLKNNTPPEAEMTAEKAAVPEAGTPAAAEPAPVKKRLETGVNRMGSAPLARALSR